jgi:pyruvate formate lyase activating enzyme
VQLGVSDEAVVTTRYWRVLDDGQIQCDVCPRHCGLKEGQRGLCFVRARQDDQIVLTTFGRSSGYCVDPIEKKSLNHFLPGTPVLSFGTAGCNLACRFCQNWDISKSREIDTLADQAPPAVIAPAARELGCRSVAFTYNDPVIFMEYAIETAKACREAGIASVADGEHGEANQVRVLRHDLFHERLGRGKAESILHTSGSWKTTRCDISHPLRSGQRPALERL